MKQAAAGLRCLSAGKRGGLMEKKTLGHFGARPTILHNQITLSVSHSLGLSLACSHSLSLVPLVSLISLALLSLFTKHRHRPSPSRTYRRPHPLGARRMPSGQRSSPAQRQLYRRRIRPPRDRNASRTPGPACIERHTKRGHMSVKT